MKKIFKNIAMMFMVGVSGITMNTEARLPKYMAPQAAELLIEASGLDFSDEYKQTISSILSNASSGDNEVVAEQIFREVEITVDDFGSCYDVCKSMIAKKIKEYNTTEESKKDQIAESVTKAVYACKLVNFLYSTKKRQHLANWFRKAYKDKKYHNMKVSEAEVELKNTFCLIKDITEETTIDGEFVNKHFPCWTGTLTCFMLGTNKNIANKALSNKEVAKRCKESLSGVNAAYKVVGILFSLELVDSWGDIKDICEKSDEPIPELSVSYDPYDCVPIPNAAYLIPQTASKQLFYQGSCMVSTIRNLVYMLCRNTSHPGDIITDNIKKDIKGAFSDSIYTVSGTTSFNKLKQFSEKILPGITGKYQPTLELFICSLNSLLREDLRESITIPTPQQYLSGQLGIDQMVVESILKKITGSHNINVTIQEKCPKLWRDWPTCLLIVNDETINKRITIAFGKRGFGEHIEIIDIK